MEKNTLTREKLNQIPQDALVDIILSQQAQINDLNNKLAFLTEQINLSNSRQFGRSSDKIDSDQLMYVFNEAEAAIADAPEEEPEIEEVIESYKRKKKKAKGKRAEDLSGFPTKEVRHTIPEEELKEIFIGTYYRMPDEVYRKLEFHPASFEVLEHHIAVYSGKDADGDRIVKAQRPAELLKNSIVTPSLAAAIMNAKYVNAVPIYRLEQEFRRMGLALSRQVMSGWMIRLAERYLSLLYDRLRQELLGSHVIHADETRVYVTKDGRKAGTKSYMWVYCSGDDRGIVLYDYQKTRRADHPREFLQNFGGTLVTDGYQVYHTLDNGPGPLKVAGCWAHARRKFVDILKAAKKSAGKDVTSSISAVAVSQIKHIYHMDDKLKDLLPDERKKERDLTVRPLVEAYFEWVRAKRSETLSSSELMNALNYSLNQEQYLRAFLDDPEIPLDNNLAERAIRPFTVGRKNWNMIDTIHGAQASAILYSIAETAKANDLKPYEYYRYLLEEIPKHMDDHDMDFLDALLPWSDALPDDCRKTK